MQKYSDKMRLKLQILPIIVFLGWNISFGQNDIKMLNSIVYDADKYKDYKGTPYLWEENKEVIIFDRNAKEYNSVIGNYNGLDGEFEVYKNDRFIRLPPYLYIKIQVINDPAVNYTLYSNIHPKLKNKYCIQHAQSSNYRVFESFIAKESNTTIQKPGKPAEIKKIIPKSNYFILAGRALIQFKLNRKKLIKKFGHKKEIKRFLKENKIKINTIEDVLPLLEFLDSNGWLIP